jgi:hypothetical protein
MKKILKLKINYLLKYWNYLQFLRTNGILIFCQNLSINAKKDLDISTFLNTNNYNWKILNKKIAQILLDKQFLIKIKNFNNILIVNDLSSIKNLSEYLKQNNVLILGYLIQKIFFFKKDFNIKKIEKKNIAESLKKRIIKFYKNNILFLLQIKKIIIKFIFLLKNKKNGNN